MKLLINAIFLLTITTFSYADGGLDGVETFEIEKSKGSNKFQRKCRKMMKSHLQKLDFAIAIDQVPDVEEDGVIEDRIIAISSDWGDGYRSALAETTLKTVESTLFDYCKKRYPTK